MAAIPPVSKEEVDLLHKFFTDNQDNIPKTIYVTVAEKVTDPTWLINECFEYLSQEGIPDRIMHMRVNILRRIKAAMEKLAENQ